jgi:PAT family beta-lactamase induction signal transducer AmpG
MKSSDRDQLSGSAGREVDPYAPPRAEPTGTVSTAAPSEGAAATPSTPRAFAWVFSTYFAEGLPYSIVHQVIAQQYFTDIGLSFSALGLTALLHTPWNVKFAWAPLVDRVGTAKRWLVGAQLILAVLLVGASFLAAQSAVMPMALLLVAMAFVAATNDIAIDAYYMRALAKGQQASLTGVRVMAYRAALLAGNGGLVMIAGTLGWSYALRVGALFLALDAVAHAALLRTDPPGEARGLPIWDTVASFFRRPGIALSLAFILTFKAGDAMMFAMNAPLLKDLGLGTAERGFYYGVLGTSASVVGSLVGGVVASRGLGRWLTPVAIVQSLAILLYVVLAAYRPSLPVIASIVIVEQLVAGIGSSVFVVFILRLCDGAHKATHFAFGTALMSVAVTGAGSVSGFVLERVGFTYLFVIAFLVSIPGVLLAPLVSRAK